MLLEKMIWRLVVSLVAWITQLDCSGKIISLDFHDLLS
jgi:hypothetical protein